MAYPKNMGQFWSSVCVLFTTLDSFSYARIRCNLQKEALCPCSIKTAIWIKASDNGLAGIFGVYNSAWFKSWLWSFASWVILSLYISW